MRLDVGEVLLTLIDGDASTIDRIDKDCIPNAIDCAADAMEWCAEQLARDFDRSTSALLVRLNDRSVCR